MFNFSHKYYKLREDEFTTIRSIHYSKEHNLTIGQVGMITIDRVPFTWVKIVKWEDKRICDIPLDLLKKDVAYGEFMINTYAEFVDGLNTILKASGMPFANNRITTKKRVFYLKKYASPQ
jgi:hypothetical protein